MKESYRKGVANHPDPKSCVGHREVAGEALTGAQAGRVLSCEIPDVRGADVVPVDGRPHRGIATDASEPRAPRSPETPGMPENSMRENRETPLASGSGTPDRPEKAISCKTGMRASVESDGQVVPAKCPNNGGPPAEGMEGSCPTKGNAEETHTYRTQSRVRVSQGLGGVREGARREPRGRFDASTQGKSRMR